MWAGRPILETPALTLQSDDDLNHESEGRFGQLWGWDFYHFDDNTESQEEGNQEDGGLNLGD